MLAVDVGCEDLYRAYPDGTRRLESLKFSALKRKAGQVLGDATLRRWLVGRAVGRWPAPAPWRDGRPAYLASCTPPPAGTEPSLPWPASMTGDPGGPIDLLLPGRVVTINPGEEADFVRRTFDDIETSLGVHRFAWLQHIPANFDARWLGALWRAWVDAYGDQRSGWPWHPYTAAERSINIMHAADSFGLPGSPEASTQLLREHADHIFQNLEYFGDHHTSNHLANNGRGLLSLGVRLDLPHHAEAGARILIEEAKRIFLPSGMMREGSSHYHLLLAKNYIDAWLLARRYRAAATAALEEIAGRALAAASVLDLPGGMPLVGDVSPDCSPSHLVAVLSPDRCQGGWFSRLSIKDQQAITELRGRMAPPSSESLLEDGWGRLDYGAWALLTYLSPDGLPPMPGHGHQDAGSFELHHGEDAIFVDIGRRSYEGRGEVDCHATAHNGLTIDGLDPFPTNKPYYTASFRQLIAGRRPSCSISDGRVHIQHGGFGRRRGIAHATRTISFDGSSVRIEDRIEGRGRHIVKRFFHTPLDVQPAENGVELRAPKHLFGLHGPGNVGIATAERWPMYGTGCEINRIEFTEDVELPWRSEISLNIQSMSNDGSSGGDTMRGSDPFDSATESRSD